jgi:hypothetical protein
MLILILLIIIICLIFYLRKESFQNINIDKKQLDNIDNSINNFKKELNLSDKEMDLNGPLLNNYLNMLVSKTPDVNSVNESNLPFIDNNNYTKYNHELKLLLNSKKIRQLFIINMLKNKINNLSGSLKNIKETKETNKKEQEQIKCLQ